MTFLDELYDRMPTFVEALCAQVDPFLFFPEVGESTSNARSLCRRCADRVPCAEWAVVNRERHGIWGGTTPPQRRRLALARGVDWSERSERIDRGRHRKPAPDVQPATAAKRISSAENLRKARQAKKNEGVRRVA